MNSNQVDWFGDKLQLFSQIEPENGIWTKWMLKILQKLDKNFLIFLSWAERMRIFRNVPCCVEELNQVITRGYASKRNKIHWSPSRLSTFFNSWKFVRKVLRLVRWRGLNQKKNPWGKMKIVGNVPQNPLIVAKTKKYFSIIGICLVFISTGSFSNFWRPF